VASTALTHRGGSRSATFWTAIARSKETNAFGDPDKASEKSSARRSIARDSRLPISPVGADTSPVATASAGSAAALPRSLEIAQLSRCTANATAGATIAAYSTPRGTSRWRTWASSWATTTRISSRL
jgi:hypothetical protein